MVDLVVGASVDVLEVEIVELVDSKDLENDSKEEVEESLKSHFIAYENLCEIGMVLIKVKDKVLFSESKEIGCLK